MDSMAALFAEIEDVCTRVLERAHVDQVFQDFLEEKVHKGEEKALVAPRAGHDNQWLRNQWICEIRSTATGEVLWACTLPKRR